MRQHNPRTKQYHTEYHGGHWNLLELTIFTIKYKHYLCIVDCHSKVPVIKQVEGFSTDKLIQRCKIIVSEYGLPSSLVLDTGTNFVSEKFKNFCKLFSIPHVVSSSYNHQSNGQAERCLKFIKRTMINVLKLMLTYICFYWRIRTPISHSLPSLVTVLFKSLTRGTPPRFSKHPELL